MKRLSMALKFATSLTAGFILLQCFLDGVFSLFSSEIIELLIISWIGFLALGFLLFRRESNFTVM